MKRHNEDNPYAAADSCGNDVPSHSMSKRMATKANHQSNCINSVSLSGNYSPPSSTSSDSSCSTNSTTLSNPIHAQLCTCPHVDCVVHDPRHSSNLPVELTTQSNPTYANNNLLLYYAHLERCRRHGQNFHQDTSSN